LLNTLTDAGVLAEDKLFATLDTRARRLRLPTGAEVVMTDTVGFIGRMPKDLFAAFRGSVRTHRSSSLPSAGTPPLRRHRSSRQWILWCCRSSRRRRRRRHPHRYRRYPNRCRQSVVAEKYPKALVMKNGDDKEVLGIGIEATPMYNEKRGPEPGKLYHDNGRGNGYLLNIGDTRVYISGDTECTKEMRALKNIDIAFVTMNLPYTMPPEEAASCVNAFKPGVVYPFHYRGSDLQVFEKAVTAPAVEVRLRDWYPKSESG
jgi:hypothetical protein